MEGRHQGNPHNHPLQVQRLTLHSPSDIPSEREPGDSAAGPPTSPINKGHFAAALTRRVIARFQPHYHILIPSIILLALAAPSITFMLPACQDYMDEIYQPLQALKFFKTHGQAFHKYGPMPNFILAPGYAVSLAWWKFNGTLGKPSEDFPYGFAHPFEQISILIVQGRVLFLLLGIACYAYLAHTLRLVTKNRGAIALSMLFCIATNFTLVHSLPTARPDSPMLAFAAAALAIYIRILYLGLSLRRCLAMVLLIVFATSSKEFAAPMFVLPYLALAFNSHGVATPAPRFDAAANFSPLKILLIGAISGLTAYALLNFVYAPHIWIERMKFWFVGPGLDPTVWGAPASRWLFAVIACTANNLGPAGSVVVIIALLAALKTCPRQAAMLALPVASALLLGIAQIKYPQDRFYTLVAVALVPIVAIGLSELLDNKIQAPLRFARNTALATAVLFNLLFATFAWHDLRGQFFYVAENDIVANVSPLEQVFLFNTFPVNPGSSRLERTGHAQDLRPLQQIAAERRQLPDHIYATRGAVQFLEEARFMPARAKMIQTETGFDPSHWTGLEAMGYRIEKTLIPQTPKWFCFDWMPAVKEWKQFKTVLVYARTPDSRQDVNPIP